MSEVTRQLNELDYPIVNPAIHCHPCTKVMLDALTQAQKLGVPDEEIEVPNPKYAFTWSFSMVNGFPIGVPVCLEHMQQAMNQPGSGLLVP